MKVLLPSQFEKVTKCREINIKGDTVEQVLISLIFDFPELEARILNEKGKLNRFLSLFVNDESISFLNCLKTQVKDTDTLTILPAIAGG